MRVVVLRSARDGVAAAVEVLDPSSSRNRLPDPASSVDSTTLAAYQKGAPIMMKKEAENDVASGVGIALLDGARSALASFDSKRSAALISARLERRVRGRSRDRGAQRLAGDLASLQSMAAAKATLKPRQVRKEPRGAVLLGARTRA